MSRLATIKVVGFGCPRLYMALLVHPLFIPICWLICILISRSRSYNSCDVSMFPNQTFRDGTGPAAAVHSDASSADYNFKLSVLPGQRLSWSSYLFLILLPASNICGPFVLKQRMYMPRPRPPRPIHWQGPRCHTMYVLHSRTWRKVDN